MPPRKRATAAAAGEDQAAALVELDELVQGAGEAERVLGASAGHAIATTAGTVAELAAAAAAAADTGEPVILERGRYRVYQAPDGAWIVARAGNLCDRCEACGCGDQADPIQVPALIIKLALAQAQAQGGGLLDRLKAVRAAGKAG